MDNSNTPVKSLKQICFALTLLTASCISSIFFAGCSSAPVDENNPVSLLKEAEEEIKSDHYQLAIDKLRMIKNKFPYSSAAIDAQLRIADVYFIQESFVEAAASYEAFKDLHPKHEKTAYAMFRIGQSYYKDIPSTLARDLTPAQKAMEAYYSYLAHYPKGPDASEAAKGIAEIRILLADKELSIGDFYFNREFYDSAKPRYKKIIELYPDTPTAKLAREKLELIGQKPSKVKSEEPSKDERPNHDS